MNRNNIDPQSQKFMRYVLKQLKSKDELKERIMREFAQWLDNITIQDLRSLALVKMTEGQKEHGSLKQVLQIEHEIQGERLDLIIWSLMRDFQTKEASSFETILTKEGGGEPA